MVLPLSSVQGSSRYLLRIDGSASAVGFLLHLFGKEVWSL
jgi:hypothetical protein